MTKPDPSPVVQVVRDTVMKLPKTLAPQHREHLRLSGLTDESIDLSGCYTARGNACSELVGWRSWPRTMGEAIAIPFFLPSGQEAPPFFHRLRPDHPRTNEKTGKVAKYEQPKGVGVAPYFPARSRREARYADPSQPLILTEGEKKAMLLDQLGYAAIGAVGVSCFHDSPHRHETDEYRFHPLIREGVVFQGRTVIVCFDSDQLENENVMRATRIVARMAYQEGAAVVINAIPTPSKTGGKRGVDDLFVDDGADGVKAIVDAAEPVPRVEHHADTVSTHDACKGAPCDGALRMPRGYSFDKEGSLFLDEGKDVPDKIERAPLLISRLLADHYTGAELVDLCFKRDARWRTVTVARKTMVDPRGLVSELGAVGGPVDGNTASKVVRWLRDFEAINERRLPKAKSLGRCGWHDVADGKRVFVLGPEVVGDDGELVPGRTPEAARLSRGLRMAGSEDAQLEGIKKAVEASPVCAVVVCAAFAAPLLRVLGVPNFAVHLTGDSSRGKSSMLKVAASVFGDPRDDEWVSSWNSTSVGHEQRAAHLCDLPLCVDESGVADAKAREQAIYMLVNGVGRTRGAKEGGLRDTQSWRTVVLSTGERQLYSEDTAATGAQVRVLQLQVDGFGQLDAKGVDNIRRACEGNYGHLGRQWIEEWATADHDSLERARAGQRAMVQRAQSEAKDNLSARQAEAWGLLMFIEHALHHAYGIGKTGGESVGSVWRDVAGETRDVVRPAWERAVEIIGEWMASEPQAFSRLTMSANGQKVSERDGNPRAVCGFFDPGQERLIFLPGALRKKLGEHGIDDRVVLRDWLKRGMLASDDGHLTAYVRFDAQRHRCVVVKSQPFGIEGVSPVSPL